MMAKSYLNHVQMTSKSCPNDVVHACTAVSMQTTYLLLATIYICSFSKRMKRRNRDITILRIVLQQSNNDTKKRLRISKAKDVLVQRLIRLLDS